MICCVFDCCGPGEIPLLEQEEGNSASTNSEVAIDDDAASHECAHGKVSDNDPYTKACADRADGFELHRGDRTGKCHGIQGRVHRQRASLNVDCGTATRAR